MSRVLVIGDVHGCVDELEQVLASAELNDHDLVVFAGDLLDKGPDPVGVVRLSRRLSERMNVVLVEGNHEYDHRAWRDAMKSGRTRKAATLPHADDAYHVVWRLCEEDICFLESAVLYKRLPSHKALVTHAGVPPKMKKLPPSNLKKVDKLSAANRDLALSMETIRYVDSAGAPVWSPKKRDKFWAEKYDGRFGTVFFGHQPFKFEKQPVGFPFAVALDLGCSVGNRLAAALLDVGKPPEYIVAPAAYRKNAAMKPIVLPDPGDHDSWLGYVQVGDRLVAVSESESPQDALAEAALMV